MLRISRPVLGLLAGLSLSAWGADAQLPHARVPVAQELLLNENCISCHGPKKQKGKFRVDELDFSIATVETAERWAKVLKQINSGEMPPENEKAPNPAVKPEFLETVSHTLTLARKALNGQPSKLMPRHLNRREYRNTILDLLGVEVNVSELPEDEDNGMFDTARRPGEMSAAQLQRYQSLGQRYLNVLFTAGAVAAPLAPAKPLKVHREPEEAANKTISGWLKSVDEKYERNAKGAKAEYEQRHQYLTDYLALPQKDTGVYLTIYDVHREDYIAALETWPVGKYTLRLRLAVLEDAPDARRFIEIGQRGEDIADFSVLSAHHVIGTMDTPQVLEIPVSILPGGKREFAMRERRQNTREAESAIFNESLKKNGTGPKPALWIDWMELEGPIKEDASLSEMYSRIFFNGPPVMEVVAKGASYLKNREYAREILQRFAGRAFHGKTPSAEENEAFLKVFETKREAGAPFDAALKDALSVILASPKFLYLSEPGAVVVTKLEEPAPKQVPAGLWYVWSDALGAKIDAELLTVEGDFVTVRVKTGASYRLNLNKLVPKDRAFAQQALSLATPVARDTHALELASRLSYFLWSAPPDEALLALGAKGELADAKVLEQQVNRLLLDPRASNFVTTFTQQWLELPRMNAFKFSAPHFRQFDDSTQIAAKDEVVRTVEYLLRSGTSLRHLLKSDFVVVNALLANYYGINGVAGDEFRPVPVPPESPRGGLLGMAAIHAVGSNGERTSPVDRGAWVLRKLLNEPMPAAPTDVPKISRLEDQLLTTQERLKLHQEQAQCVACHRRIDPIGLGLENFDAVGRWRKEDVYEKQGVGKKAWPIEASGTFHKGPPFKSYFELRNVIESKSERFARGFTEALIEYALGHPCGFLEADLIEGILAQARQKDFSANEFVQALVRSPEFRTK